jgi:SPP1 gp7 family putative phage head morphogenesis protein
MAIRSETLRLLRRLRAAVGREADDTVRTLAKAWALAWDELSGAWREAAADLAAQAARDGRWPSPWQVARVERLADAMNASTRALSVLAVEARLTIAPAVLSAVTATGRDTPHILASQLPKVHAGPAADRFAGRVAPTVLDAIVQRVTGRVTALTRPLSADSRDVMQRALIRGVAIGDNPRTVAAQMVARVQGAFNGGLARAVTISRTEILDAHRSAASAVHGANADVMSGWVWLASVSRRSCSACIAMHGTSHPVDQPGPLGHPNCRCSRAPKVKPWRDLGIDLDEPADLIPDARTAFAALAPADQLRIMGPARLAMLRNGDIGWADLARLRDNPGWRQSYEPTPIADLRRIASRAA